MRGELTDHMVWMSGRKYPSEGNETREEGNPWIQRTVGQAVEWGVRQRVGRIIDGNYTGRYYGLLISFLSEVVWQIHGGSEYSILGMQVCEACIEYISRGQQCNWIR